MLSSIIYYINGELYVLHGEKIKLINYVYLPMYMTFNIYVIGSFIGRGIAVIIYNKYYVIMLFDLVNLMFNGKTTLNENLYQEYPCFHLCTQN